MVTNILEGDVIVFEWTLTLLIDHFIVMCLVTSPLNESEAGVDLALIETSHAAFLMQIPNLHVNNINKRKAVRFPSK